MSVAVHLPTSVHTLNWLLLITLLKQQVVLRMGDLTIGLEGSLSCHVSNDCVYVAPE